MKYIIFIMMILLSCNIVFSDNMRYVALSLKSNDTIMNVQDYVINNIEYEFNWRPQSLNKIWSTKKGDCTDQATLMKYMLQVNDIRTYYVHGYCDGMKHDWLRLNQSFDIDNFYCDKKVYIGKGVW